MEIAVRALDESCGTFSVTIAGTKVHVDTSVQVTQLTLFHLQREAMENMVALPGREYGAIAGLMITTTVGTHHRSSVFQLCVGRRCILLPLADNQRLPPDLTNFLKYFLKIVAIGLPVDATCFGGTVVQSENPWQIAVAMGRPELREFATLDSLAGFLMGQLIIRPQMEVPVEPAALRPPWPPAATRVANLCADVFLLREIGMSLMLS